MLIDLTLERTDFFAGFMPPKIVKKYLQLFLNCVFLRNVSKVSLFDGTVFFNADPDPAASSIRIRIQLKQRCENYNVKSML